MTELTNTVRESNLTNEDREVFRFVGYPSSEVYGPEAAAKTGIFRVLASSDATANEVLDALNESIDLGDGFEDLITIEPVIRGISEETLGELGLTIGTELEVQDRPCFRLRVEAVDRLPHVGPSFVSVDIRGFDDDWMEEIDALKVPDVNEEFEVAGRAHYIFAAGTIFGCMGGNAANRRMRKAGMPDLGDAWSAVIGLTQPYLPTDVGRLILPECSRQPKRVLEIKDVQQWSNLPINEVCAATEVPSPPCRRPIPIRQLYYVLEPGEHRRLHGTVGITVIRCVDFLELKGRP